MKLTSSLVVRLLDTKYVWKPAKPATDHTEKKLITNTRAVDENEVKEKHVLKQKTGNNSTNVSAEIVVPLSQLHTCGTDPSRFKMV